MFAAPHPLAPRSRQRGAALIVMLVIMILGAITIFVSSLNSSSLNIERDKVTADALAKAKEALIGYAASDSNRPGELPCPDFDNDGMSTPANDYTGSNCKSLIGWLPWKTLGLPELRDSNGDHLWYAVADPFHANSSITLNSDTPTINASSMLSVKDGATGLVQQDKLIAIIFSPGVPLNSSRSPNDNNATTALPNYLEGENANLDMVFQTSNANINDRLLTIDRNQLFTPVEMRIAREVRICLDSYAASNSNKYPWAAPVSPVLPLPPYTGQQGTLFGRISDIPNIDITGGGGGTPLSAANDPNFAAISNALTSLSSAMTNCAASDSGANITALANAAQSLLTATTSLPTPPYTSSFTTQAANLYGLATTANACWNIEQNHVPSFISSINSSLSATTSALGNLTTTGTPTQASGMSTSWPYGCFANTMTPATSSLYKYWSYWKDLVFYQVDDQYKPSNSAPVSSSITINGVGTYRAAVLIARQAIISNTPSRPSTTSPPTPYLEGINPHTGTTPSTSFETYSPSDTANFTNVNDLVLCVDGGNNPGAGGNCK